MAAQRMHEVNFFQQNAGNWMGRQKEALLLCPAACLLLPAAAPLLLQAQAGAAPRSSCSTDCAQINAP